MPITSSAPVNALPERFASAVLSADRSSGRVSLYVPDGRTALPIARQLPSCSAPKEKQFRTFFREAVESGGTLIAIDARDGHVIASSRFHAYDGETSEVEIGWTFLATSHWGGRYNGEMKELMLQHAFRFVDRVVFLVGPQNRRSQRAVERIGGARVGSRSDASGRDSIVYQITAAEFARRGPGSATTRELHALSSTDLDAVAQPLCFSSRSGGVCPE